MWGGEDVTCGRGALSVWSVRGTNQWKIWSVWDVRCKGVELKDVGDKAENKQESTLILI